jgi:hypothetical protein
VQEDGGGADAGGGGGGSEGYGDVGISPTGSDGGDVPNQGVGASADGLGCAPGLWLRVGGVGCVGAGATHCCARGRTRCTARRARSLPRSNFAVRRFAVQGRVGGCVARRRSAGEPKDFPDPGLEDVFNDDLDLEPELPEGVEDEQAGGEGPLAVGAGAQEGGAAAAPSVRLQGAGQPS